MACTCKLLSDRVWGLSPFIHLLLVSGTLVIMGAAVEPTSPLTVLNLKDCYGVSTTDVTFTVRNGSDQRLSVVLSVERQMPDGKWIEFSPDLFQPKSFPEQRVALVLEAGETRRVQWHPYETGNFFCLVVGDYRLLANVYDSVHREGRPVVLARFAVRPECSSPAEKRVVRKR